MTGTRRQTATEGRGVDSTRTQTRAARTAPLRAKLRLDDWPVAAKVVAVLAIPALIAAVFGLTQVQSQLAAAGRDATAVAQTGVLGPAWEVLSAADDVMNGADAAGSARLLNAIEDLTDARDRSSLDEDQREEISDIISAANQIAEHPGADSIAAPAEIGRTLSDVASDIHSSDAQTNDRVDAFREIVTARLALGDQRWTVSHPVAIASARTMAMAAEMGAESVALSRVTGDPGVIDAVRVLLDRNSSRLSQLSYDGLPAQSALVSTAQRYDEASALSISAITAKMSDAALQARSQALLATGFVLGLLLLGLAAALVVARSLTRPLQTVRTSAHEIADVHLPRDVADVLAGNELQAMPRVPVTSDEEMGQLARAVESMYGRARELATAQAVLRQQVAGMFETLSRRSNALVERQLSLVEKLERDEPDPQRLGQLFELDHLAARMRRNGESLLVLAGAKGRSSRAVQLSIVDAARAASAEVADYQRVVIADIGTQVVTATVSSDLIHLFAELIDNALSYSPPTTEVVLVGARTADGGMLIEILDEGLGIEDAEREELNAVLRSSTALTPESARRMGLFVVGRLAELHGIAVTLRPNPSGGTIAAVALPAETLVVGRSEGTRPITTTLPLPTPETTGRLAPVADITSRAVVRDDAPGDPNRPALARRVRGANGPEAAQVEASAEAPVDAPAGEALTHPALPTRQPARSPFAPPSAGAPAHDEPAAADTAVRRAAAAAAMSAATSGGAPATAPNAIIRPGSIPRLDDDHHTPRLTTPEVDPSTGDFEDTLDPRTIRTWVTAASAEPGDLDDRDDVSPSLAVETVSSGTGEPVAAPPRDEPAPVYNSTRSRWLTDTGSLTLPWDEEAPQVLAGRAAAARALRPTIEATTTSGLPRRAPGAHLVPGTITTSDLASRRLDPETVRESMNRHLAGVRRGRAVAADAAPTSVDE